MRLALELPWPHPALAGHFPGEPILPGVVLLDEALHAIEAASGATGPWRIGSVKFLGTIVERPTLTLEFDRAPSGLWRFALTDRGRPVAAGTVVEPSG